MAPLCCPPEENLQVYTLTDLRNLAYRTISRMANWSLPQPKLKTFRQYPKPNGPQETLRCVVPGTGLVITTTHLQTTLTLSCVDGLSGRIVDRLTWERILKSGGPSDDGWKAEQGRFVLAFVVTPVSGNPWVRSSASFSGYLTTSQTCLGYSGRFLGQNVAPTDVSLPSCARTTSAEPRVVAHSTSHLLVYNSAQELLDGLALWGLV